MSDVSISVLRDPESSDSAIIRLTGVALLPPGSIFRISPIDENEGATTPDGWPAGDLKPLRQRITSDGVDLLMGPEVIAAPALLPGTPVSIAVPSVGASGELRWPDLPPPKAERRQNVVMTPGMLAREHAARAEAERDDAAALAVEADSDDIHPLAPAHEANGDAFADPPASARAAAAAAAAAARSLMGDRPAAGATVRDNGSEVAGSLPTPPAPSASPRTELASLQRPEPQSPKHAGLAAPVLPPPNAPLSPGRALPGTRTVADDDAVTAPSSSALSKGGALVPTARGMTTSADVASTIAQPGRAMAATEPRASKRRGGSVLAFLAGALVATGVAIGAFKVAGDAPGHWLGLSGAKPSDASRTETAPYERLGKILDFPLVSPLGRKAADVGLDDALMLADKSLYGGPEDRNRDEAKYWLRKALSDGIGDRRMLWALTQLGSLYAQPDTGAPDYAAARELWSLAATKGDPVAVCFLASLSEHGLGTSRDLSRALSLYRSAKALGGCRNVDAAIARLKKDAP